MLNYRQAQTSLVCCRFSATNQTLFVISKTKLCPKSVCITTKKFKRQPKREGTPAYLRSITMYTTLLGLIVILFLDEDDSYFFRPFRTPSLTIEPVKNTRDLSLHKRVEYSLDFETRITKLVEEWSTDNRIDKR